MLGVIVGLAFVVVVVEVDVVQVGVVVVEERAARWRERRAAPVPLREGEKGSRGVCVSREGGGKCGV